MGVSIAQLRAYLLADPHGLGLAALIQSGNHQTITDRINAPSVLGRKRDAFLTSRGVWAVLGPLDGESFLQGIATASQEQALPGVVRAMLARAVRILDDLSGGGLDVSNSDLQAQLDMLSAAGFVTADSVVKIKAYGTRLWSRAEVQFGDGVFVSLREVSESLAEDSLLQASGG